MASLLVPQSARADEPVPAGEPRFLRETGEVTSVVDAFDDDDPFDAHLWLGFLQRWRSSKIRRETNLAQPGLSTGGFVASTENVAQSSQAQSILQLGADIGIYKDFALRIRLPLILSDSRSLEDLNGSSRNPERFADSTGDPLFSLPFKSPARSGVDYVAVGLDYGIFNQWRDPSKPNWVIGIEGRIPAGTPLHACNDAPTPGADGTVPPKCPNFNRRTDSRDPGISRGVTGVVVHTTFSRRIANVEPYTGLGFKAEFPTEASDFGDTSSLQGALLNRPPLLGDAMVGVEIIPWENREAFQRFVVDVRAKGSYLSPGRDYSELFDALGSSSARTLTRPNPGGYTNGVVNVNGEPQSGSVADPTKPVVNFTGITDQQAHGTFGTHVQITWQAGEYVKFNLGGALTFVQSHLITAADACNPDITNDPDKAGPCRSNDLQRVITGIPNPMHRASIDSVGRRFEVAGSTQVDLWLNGVVLF